MLPEYSDTAPRNKRIEFVTALNKEVVRRYNAGHNIPITERQRMEITGMIVELVGDGLLGVMTIDDKV